jgi:glycosyltransferase involved in cell wall biosynthesis
MSKRAEELDITPLILTYNEEPNIYRTLNALRWAGRVVVLDSGSNDKTEEIARSFENVSWQTRAFDNHKTQWEYGIHQTGIETEYVLSLDADYEVPAAFVEELARDFMPGNWAGGLTAFTYSFYGHPLSGSVYPAQFRVFKQSTVRVAQLGHTQVFEVDGPTYTFRTRLIHDDRKPLERWVSSQLAYQVLNEEILSSGGRRWRDHLRRMGLMPPIMALLAYFRAGGPLRGAAAARYAYERAVCESLLAIRVMNSRLRESEEEGTEQPQRAAEHSRPSGTRA